jgi:hypothetical protein
MKKAEIKAGQTLFDMALQMQGSLEGVFELTWSNGLELTQELVAGTELQIEGDAIEAPVVKDYVVNGIFPASGLASAAAKPGGIGYMAIGVDFIVS